VARVEAEQAGLGHCPRTFAAGGRGRPARRSLCRRPPEEREPTLKNFSEGRAGASIRSYLPSVDQLGGPIMPWRTRTPPVARAHVPVERQLGLAERRVPRIPRRGILLEPVARSLTYGRWHSHSAHRRNARGSPNRGAALSLLYHAACSP
jgi:hypothetical protein